MEEKTTSEADTLFYVMTPADNLLTKQEGVPKKR